MKKFWTFGILLFGVNMMIQASWDPRLLEWIRTAAVKKTVPEGVGVILSDVWEDTEDPLEIAQRYVGGAYLECFDTTSFTTPKTIGLDHIIPGMSIRIAVIASTAATLEDVLKELSGLVDEVKTLLSADEVTESTTAALPSATPTLARKLSSGSAGGPATGGAAAGSRALITVGGPEKPRR